MAEAVFVTCQVEKTINICNRRGIIEYNSGEAAQPVPGISQRKLRNIRAGNVYRLRQGIGVRGNRRHPVFGLDGDLSKVWSVIKDEADALAGRKENIRQIMGGGIIGKQVGMAKRINDDGWLMAAIVVHRLRLPYGVGNKD